MDIKSLRYFVSVYEQKSISLAAQKIFISQPALSNAIHQLENELEVKLFERNKKGVTATSDADFLYPISCQIIQEVIKIPEMFKSENQKSDRFKLAIPEEISQLDISRELSHIKEACPSIDLTLVREHEEADARITLKNYKKDYEDFLLLWQEQYVLCMHKEHPLAYKDHIYLKDLHRQNFIECPPCEAHLRTISQISQAGLSCNVIASAQSKNQVLSLLISGFGISFLPRNMANSSEALVIKSFEETPMYREMGLAYPKKLQHNSALTQILAFFEKKLKDGLS